MLTHAKQRHRQPRNDMTGPALLQALFPVAPAPAGVAADSAGAAAAGRWLPAVAVHAVALAAGVLVMLARIPGQPAWYTIYNEDVDVYLEDALARPWHLFIPYAGYLQLMPRVVGQLAALLPLQLAAEVFALTGALTAAACAVLVFHASAGHIRSLTLRVLAGASVLLLPIATLEIADSTVGTSWYLLLALFWAALWRPRTRWGMAAAAAVAFLASSAEPLTLVFAPIFAVRVVVLRRLRDHAVTIGWVAGLLVQLPAVLASETAHQSRVNALAPVGDALAFYVRAVVQSALGWHVSWWLQSAVGADGAAAIVGAVLAAFFAWALLAGPAQARPLIATALLTGFAFTIVATVLGYRFAGAGRGVTVTHEAGSRYGTLGIFLIDCAVIVAIDALIQRLRASRRDDQDDDDDRSSLPPRIRGRLHLPGLHRPGLRRPGLHRLAPGLALLAVLAVLSAGWVTDYRFQTPRAAAPSWAADLARWRHGCAGNQAAAVRVPAWDLPAGTTEGIPCARIMP